ncbi:LacI family DNA-binding transcriptional regulator [Devosia rhizoryzae]|uniref:LacI family DNA-binding transcriptional regulator n=1 Tax=Devosia rhizoryzae TaxID=2774137 RepID=A0ABX7C4X7_9HYPH|nr:LacI family DNA-binding transcriptional regulator [Devosia rhizoryzae]QQR39271.1 LacI family DNA-binding transcriptional regulator [Devosia rhizoryzae]
MSEDAKPPATIFDIAAAAGVSIATADRAVNGRKGVAQKTAERVLQAAERLNWKPNPAAQTLSRRASVALDVVLPKPSNPFMSLLVESVDAARESFEAFRVAPRACIVDELDPASLARQLDDMRGRPEGIALLGLQHPLVVEAVNRLEASGTPVVTLVSDVLGCNRQAYVGIDNYAGGRAAAALLGRFLGSGGGHVAVFAGTPLYTDIIQRQAGFLEVAKARFPTMRPLPSVWNVEDDAHSYEVAQIMLSERQDLSGIYVAGGGQLGVASALRESGRAANVTMVAHDIFGSLAPFLRDGTIDAAINQNPEIQVTRALQMLNRFKARLQPVSQITHTAIEISIAETLPG